MMGTNIIEVGLKLANPVFTGVRFGTGTQGDQPKTDLFAIYLQKLDWIWLYDHLNQL